MQQSYNILDNKTGSFNSIMCMSVALSGLIEIPAYLATWLFLDKSVGTNCIVLKAWKQLWILQSWAQVDFHLDHDVSSHCMSQHYGATKPFPKRPHSSSINRENWNFSIILCSVGVCGRNVSHEYSVSGVSVVNVHPSNIWFSLQE